MKKELWHPTKSNLAKAQQNLQNVKQVFIFLAQILAP